MEILSMYNADSAAALETLRGLYVDNLMLYSKLTIIHSLVFLLCCYPLTQGNAVHLTEAKDGSVIPSLK
jgi:hypothetical protein